MPVLADAFREHERLLWSMCYRLTGSAADADDLVQETFARALEKPPRGEMRPWLVTIALNLGRDLLRRRRRQRYVGPWLPSPVETPAPEAESAPARYGMLESATFAFLLALEALSPPQRAVLILRDVYDYSVEETAQALDLSPGNVKVTHLRARRKMADYDQARCQPTPELFERQRAALERFLAALATDDVAAAEAALAAPVKAWSDGAGEFYAARVPIFGVAKVVAFFAKLTRSRGVPDRFAVRILNGLPAVVVEWDHPGPGQALRVVQRCEIDAAGQIVELQSILATRKLTAVRPV
jgi:RNA polymerase sigma-70 factor (ECF subfamily)